MTPKEGGHIIEGKGNFLTILQMQIDKSWKLSVERFTR